MKITVTMELTQENLSKLRALLPDTEIPGQVSMFDSPSEKPVEPTAEAPKTEAPAPATEAPKTEDKAYHEDRHPRRRPEALQSWQAERAR